MDTADEAENKAIPGRDGIAHDWDGLKKKSAAFSRLAEAQGIPFQPDARGGEQSRRCRVQPRRRLVGRRGLGATIAFLVPGGGSSFCTFARGMLQLIASDLARYLRARCMAAQRPMYRYLNGGTVGTRVLLSWVCVEMRSIGVRVCMCVRTCV